MALLALIRIAIYEEPAFLAHFLHAVVLMEVLERSALEVLLQSNCEALIVTLACLSGSMCITLEGLAFVFANRLLPLAMSILVDSSLVIP